MQPSLKLIETGTQRRGKKEGPCEERADNLNRLPALSETPKNNTGGRRTATFEHDPDPEGRPARARNGFVRAHVVFVDIIMPQLHTKCKWFSFAFVESRYAVATRTEASTSYRRENGKKRPTTPSCRRPFGETPENNKRRRYAGRRTVFPSVRTDPPESTPLTPLCDGCCFPLDSLCTRGPTNAIHSHFEM